MGPMGTQRIMVTGGAGFLGSHLCRRLVAAGHHVVCVDNLMTGARRNIEALQTQPHFSFVQHDIIQPLPRPLAVDAIYNLACAASPPAYQRDPVHTMKTCVLGMLHVLELAQEQGAKVLQASTSEIYGDPHVHPQPESYRGNVNPIGPRACYDEGKRAAETLIFDCHRRHHTPIRVARIFNTYGPMMDPQDGRVISNFIMQALKGAPLTLYGAGTQTRSFCYVDDLIDGLVKLMDAPDSVTGPINLGNPGEFTIRQLSDVVLELTGSESSIEHRPLPTDDPVQRQPVIDRARELLSWTPQVPLRAGLQRTIDYFRGIV